MTEPKQPAQECLILNDDELASAGASLQHGFRRWRMDANELAASRIFGGGAAAATTGIQESSTLRQFPSAFQTYKPGSSLPKRVNGGGSGNGKRFPFFEHKPKTEKPPISGATAVVSSPQIQIPPTPPEGEEPRYAACTPPCYSPKTPPYWPENGVDAQPTPLEISPPKQDEQSSAAVGTA